MKNQNKVRSYWGYHFIFEDASMIANFIKLYGDLFIDYQIGGDWNKEGWIKIVVGKGVIPKIKEGLGDLVRCERRRYYVKAA